MYFLNFLKTITVKLLKPCNQSCSLSIFVAYNHKNEGYVDEISKNEGKFDIIIEMLANKNLQNDLTLLGRSGRIMVRKKHKSQLIKRQLRVSRFLI